MPIDLEMLLSASNHNFFPYSSYDNTSYPDSPYDRSLSFNQNHCVPRSPAKHGDPFRKKLEHGSYINTVSYNKKEKVVPREELYGVRKKKVSFADDKGFNLVEVREIPGAPKWADDVITLLIGNTKRTVVKEKRWKVAFEHPPWSDEKLIDTLEKNMVALEHVSVKEESDDFLIGSVKVKNIAFEKNIFLRVTFDRWLSYVDIPCTYMKPNKESTSPNKYDTFHFRAKILPVAARYEVIEFCVCFQCDGREYWDNNKGINYRLTVEYIRSCVSDSYEKHMPASGDESLTDISRDTDEIFECNKSIRSEPC